MHSGISERRPSQNGKIIRLALAAIIIIASFVCNLLVVTQNGEATGRSIVAIGPALTNAAIRQSQMIYNGHSIGVPLPQMGFIALAYLLWLIPAGAAYMAYKEIQKSRSKQLELAVAVAAIMALGYVILRIALSSHARSLVQQNSDFAVSMPTVELGIAAIIVPICGVALLIVSRRMQD